MFSNVDKTYKSIVPRTRGIDPRMAFHAWMETGTLEKAALYLMNEKDSYNKKMDKPFSKFGLRHAACRFIATSHEEAKPVLLKSWKRQGVTITTDEWNKFVVEMATKYLESSKARFMRWLEANPWAERYDYVYARKYGLEQKNRPPV